MGEVFGAVAVGPDGFEKPVVIKRILSTYAQREDATRLFVAEAKLMTKLAHPNIVQVIDFGRGDDGAYFLVLELVDGVDLGRFCAALEERGDRTPVPIALLVVSQMLRGLHHAHTRAGAGGALVHRDVSPGNVLLSTVGEVKVADFGVALVAERERSNESGVAVVGKPAYMAPEQILGGAVDPRADVFACGIVLYQVLTGELPFSAQGVLRLEAIRRGDFPRASALREGVSEKIDEVLARALAARPQDRWSDARAMAQAIEALRDGGQPIATSDDLAEAVASVARGAAPQGRPVVRLGDVAAKPLEASSIRELTRFAGDDMARFTVKMTTAADDRGREVAREDSIMIPKRPLRVPFVAMLVGALLVSFAVLALRAAAPANPAPASTGTAAASGASTVAAPAAGEVADTETTVRGADPPQPETRATRRPSTVAPAPSAPSGSTPGHVLAAPSGANEPRGDCRGNAHFLSNGSWSITGGPAPVQTPGSYEWPCGTYALSARSRLDPTQSKATSLTVRPGAVARWDLR
jgi:hypothetical protein